MTIYRYDSKSLIDEVRVVTNATGGHRAYLHARSDATPEQLNEIQYRLKNQGWQCVPFSDRGQPLLEVRGFKKGDEFCSYLKTHGWCTGKEQVEKLKSDVVSKKEKLRNATLNAAGFVYNVGDAAYLIYAGMGLAHEKKELAAIQKYTAADVAKASADIGKTVTKDALIADGKELVQAGKLNVGAGVGYSLGSFMLTFFGSKDQSQQQVKDATRKVQGFLRKEHLHVAQDSAMHDITEKKKETFGEKVHHFLKRYPSEMLNTIYVGVGLLLATSSYKNAIAPQKPTETAKLFQSRKNADYLDIGLGALTAASALTGIMVKEKKHIDGEPRKKGIGRLFEWIQEKPLRAVGYGYMGSTLVHAVATGMKYRDGNQQIRKQVLWRGIFVAANIGAEILMAVSSKGHGQGVKSDHSVDDTVVATAAEQIAKQNPAYQNQLIDQLSGFMASPEVLGGKAETIASKLREQLATIQQNPWCAAKTAVNNIAKEEPKSENKRPKTTIAADSIDLPARELIKPPEQLGALHI